MPGGTTSSAPAAQDRFYLPELDGLRFCAFLAVFASHVLSLRPEAWGASLAPLGVALARAGANGVDLFFVLSGFLITELLRREHLVTGGIAWKAFYVRRALRIWPLYYGFLIALALNPLGLARMEPPHLLLFLLLVGNLGAARWGVPHTAGDQLWSVCVEEQFYLSWPILLSLTRRNLWRILPWTLIACSLAARLWFWRERDPGVVFWTHTLTRLDAIACGCLLALTLDGRLPRWNPGIRLMLIGGGTCLLLLLAGWGRGEIDSLPEAVLRYPLVAVACAAVLLGVVGAEGGLLAHLLRSAPLVYLGRVSYGLYVFHVVGSRVAERWLPPPPTGALHAWQAVALAITIGLASLSYFLWERPFLRWKERFSRVPSRPV